MKKSFSFIILSLLFFRFPIMLFSQGIETSVAETLVDESEPQKSTMKQRISWEGDEYAWQYGVQIFSAEDEKQVLFLTTQETFVTFSLSPGEYKYKILVYDLFGHVALESKMCDFSIAKAVQPKIEIVNEKISAPSKSKKVELPVELDDVYEDSVIVFVNTKTNEEVVADFTVPKEDVESEGGTNISKLTVPKINEGTWKVKVINPGGKTTISEDINIGYEKPAQSNINVFFSAEAHTLNFIHASDVLKLFNEETSYRYGGRLSVLPFNKGRNHLGFELFPAYSRMKSSSSYFDAKLDFITMYVNCIYQFDIFKNWLIFNARAGVGASVIMADIEKRNGTNLYKEYGYPAINAHASLLFKPRTFTFEIGYQADLFIMKDQVVLAAFPNFLFGFKF